MPPWPAFPGYGQFINDNSLTLRETQFIVSWVEGSGPRNAGTVFTNTSDPNAARRTEVRAKADFGTGTSVSHNWCANSLPTRSSPTRPRFAAS